MVTHREVGSVFKALADPVRRRILDRLAVKGLPVREIAARFPVSRPAISKHLRVLRQAGLVRVERLGRERVYTLVAGRPALAGDWLTALEAGRPVEESRWISITGPVRLASPVTGSCQVEPNGSIKKEHTAPCGQVVPPNAWS